MITFDGPFVGSLAVADGSIGRAMLSGPRFVRLFPDVYVRADIPPTMLIRSEAARLFVGEAAVLSGYSAAAVLAADCVPYQADAEVTTVRHVRPRPGLLVHRARLEHDEVINVNGTPVTSPVRTAYDLIRRLSLIEGVAVADCLARIGCFGSGDLEAILRRHRGARWKRRAPACVDLMDPKSESIMESRLRVGLVIRGLPHPICQFEVFDADGGFVARLDMAYPWAKLAIEYDGAQHRSGAAQLADLRRHNRLLANGWRVLRFTADDVYRRPAETAAAVWAALRVSRSAG